MLLFLCSILALVHNMASSYLIPSCTHVNSGLFLGNILVLSYSWVMMLFFTPGPGQQWFLI